VAADADHRRAAHDLRGRLVARVVALFLDQVGDVVERELVGLMALVTDPGEDVAGDRAGCYAAL
jgi:hypothetical protein